MRKSDPELNKKIGERIKQCRIAKNMTRTDLAKMVNLTSQHICNIETGRRGLSLSNALILARIFDVDPEYLLCESDWAKKEDYEELQDYMLDDFQQMVMQLISYCGYHRHGFICRTSEGKYYFESCRHAEKRFSLGTQFDSKVQYFVFEHDNQLEIASVSDINGIIFDVYNGITYAMTRKTETPALVPGFEKYSAVVGEYLSYSVDKNQLLEAYKNAIQTETPSSEPQLLDEL